MDGSPVRNRHTSLSADEAYDSFAGIRPFRRARPLWARASRILRGVLVDWQPRVVFGLLLADVLAWMLFAAYTADNATVGLKSLSAWMSLDVLQMAACMLEIWTRAQRPTSTFSFGYQRHAVLARCTVAVVTMFVATFLGKEGFEAVLVPGQTPSTFQFSHGVAAVSVFALRALNMSMARHVHRGTASAGVAVHPLSTPSKLQQRHRGAELLASGTVTTIIVLASIFGSIPGKVAFWAGYGAIANACFLAWLAAPVLRCNARILLQTAPRELLGPIAKALREASTFDGVLEFRNERFWSVAPGHVTGCLQVRVRRDANEQAVLSQVAGKLTSFVSPEHLTIQVVKDR